MIGRLLINGIDVYAIYGVMLTDGAHKALVQYPPLKSVTSIDWAEHDGKDFDLSNPQLDTRKLSIAFAYVGESRLGAFIEMISTTAYHTFEFGALGRTYRLRLTSHPNLDMVKTFGLFTLTFADDFPLLDYEYVAPQSNHHNIPQGYEISYITRDTVINQDVTITNSLSDYGVYVTSGIDDIIKAPKVKTNLLRNINSSSGVIYDDSRVVYQTKDVSINCLMRADTLLEFWRNYDALLFDLARPKEKGLYVNATGYEYSCFYKSSTVQEFHIRNAKVWFKFSIMLCFTAFRPCSEELVLAAESGCIIVTEDGKNEINMKMI